MHKLYKLGYARLTFLITYYMSHAYGTDTWPKTTNESFSVHLPFLHFVAARRIG